MEYMNSSDNEHLPYVQAEWCLSLPFTINEVGETA